MTQVIDRSPIGPNGMGGNILDLALTSDPERVLERFISMVELSQWSRNRWSLQTVLTSVREKLEWMCTSNQNQKRKKCRGWMSEEIRGMIKHKQKLWYKIKSNKDKTEYRRQCIRLTKSIEKKKTEIGERISVNGKAWSKTYPQIYKKQNGR